MLLNFANKSFLNLPINSREQGRGNSAHKPLKLCIDSIQKTTESILLTTRPEKSQPQIGDVSILSILRATASWYQLTT
jgi:hypothetical protein